jgi:hypothetical protein
MIECQHHNLCGGHCETAEELDDGLFAGCLCADRERQETDAAIAAIRNAVLGYYAALDRREHGVVAQDKAFREIEQALGMRWVQGASITNKTPNGANEGL